MKLESIVKSKISDSYVLIHRTCTTIYKHLIDDFCYVTGNHRIFNKIQVQFVFFQIWIKREIDIEIGKNSSHLTDKENDMSCDIKVEIDIAEEESVDSGELVVIL